MDPDDVLTEEEYGRLAEITEADLIEANKTWNEAARLKGLLEAQPDDADGPG